MLADFEGTRAAELFALPLGMFWVMGENGRKAQLAIVMEYKE